MDDEQLRQKSIQNLKRRLRYAEEKAVRLKRDEHEWHRLWYLALHARSDVRIFLRILSHNGIRKSQGEAANHIFLVEIMKRYDATTNILKTVRRLHLKDYRENTEDEDYGYDNSCKEEEYTEE